MAESVTKKQTVGQPLPPIPTGFQLPFYYASLSNCEVLYLVDPARIKSYLANTGLEIAMFAGRGCVSFNYQLYTGQFPNGSNQTQEIELNIVAFPASEAHRVADVTFQQFVLGEEQSKIMGNHRVHVPCDDDIAIKAGVALFGEPKFKTTFTVNIPSLNDPTVKTWQFTCNDPAHPTSTTDYIFSCEADVSRLEAVPSDFSPTTEYGTHGGKLIAARWDILQPFAAYMLKGEEHQHVKLHYGQSTHAMRKDMQALIGDIPAAAVRVFQSQPIAVQCRAYYP